MTAEFSLVLCTCPDADTAKNLGEALVEAHQAACVNIVPELTSIYGWEERVALATEQLLIIKTTQDRFESVEAFIRARHPYEVPEIIAVPVTQGSHGYLDWIRNWVHRVS